MCPLYSFVCNTLQYIVFENVDSKNTIILLITSIIAEKRGYIGNNGIGYIRV